MVAEVVVNHKSKSLDKVFDYAISDGIDVKIGSSVIVPFGSANKPKEAYVVKIKEKSSAKKLKAIERLSKDIQLFDEKQLELIKWMREKYLVTYLDAIHAVSPSGTEVKPEEWLVLTEEVKHGETDEIILRLAECGDASEINRFMAKFDVSIKTRLAKLVEQGRIKREFRDARTIGDKLITVCELNIEDGELPKVLQALEKSNAHIQAKMVELLSECGRLSLADLVNFSGGSYSGIRSLLKKGYIVAFEVEVMREPKKSELSAKEKPCELTSEQKDVLKSLLETANKKEYKPYLLHGVTGSGKTEVYMRLIEETIKGGRQAIVLVPEISLTPQMVARFKSRFGKRTAVIHSGLSLGEKYDQWKKINSGDADIVIGARSAIFAPFKNIGAIIVDEEHEQTYKSEMSPRYETHEVAEFRAKQYGAVLVFASATPLVTSYYKAEQGEYTLLEMKTRVNQKAMPKAYVVDLRQELENGNRSVISEKLQEEIGENLEKGEQTILFLNRRGFSTFVSCRKCGYVVECPNCSISLKYHKFDDTLRCHYCGHTIPNYKKCPECGSGYIRYFGGGTQKVEEEIKELFPNATTIRMDVDTTGAKNSHSEILNKFEKEKIDILIGTQMVTKGLDFPDVTLVGVISADTILNIDDYRSGERTFSILEQVTGRAGRAEKTGRSVIQTYSPENKAIEYMCAHNYQDFYHEELHLRKAMWYPPFCSIVSVIFSGSVENNVSKCAKFFAKNLAPLTEMEQKTQILGPVPAYVSKIKNKYIYRLLIKCENIDALNETLILARDKCKKNANYENISVVIDKNPNSL
ncbi:MAG: primosomal protein N' [Clostridia bacterium]|nr:primosomal protein N' [Clostridia bacterium]